MTVILAVWMFVVMSSATAGSIRDSRPSKNTRPTPPRLRSFMIRLLLWPVPGASGAGVAGVDPLRIDPCWRGREHPRCQPASLEKRPVGAQDSPSLGRHAQGPEGSTRARRRRKKETDGWLYERQRARYTRGAEGTRGSVRQRTPAKGEQRCL